jgi:Protein of unknown function (DUF3489)
MPKLSDTQAVLLATAAARADLSVLPAPETIRLKGAALERSLGALVRRGLIAEATGSRRGRRSKWTVANGGHRRLVVTPAGLEALGVEAGENAGPETKSAPAAPPAAAQAADAASRPGGKLGVLLDAVWRPEGATLEELTAAVDWLPHTTRAALTRLRQRGYDVRLASMGSRKAYHLVPSD